MEAFRQILRQIRESLSSIQTFLDVVNLDGNDPKLMKLYQTSKENLTQVKGLLRKLEACRITDKNSFLS